MLAELEGDNAGLKTENDGLRSENEILRADVARFQLRVGENNEYEKESRRCRREGRATAPPCESTLRHADVADEAETDRIGGPDGNERRRRLGRSGAPTGRPVGASALHMAYMEALEDRQVTE